MDLRARGLNKRWKLEGRSHSLGTQDISAEEIHQFSGPAEPGPEIRIRTYETAGQRKNIEISWTKRKVRLNGDYLIRLDLSQEEIATFFTAIFGDVMLAEVVKSLPKKRVRRPAK